jgi:phosphopantothenate---cysteine ligase (CTP)
MRILVTAGNTQVPIDRVRVITNVFTGRTGTLIALEAVKRDHEVTLLTSHPELLSVLYQDTTELKTDWTTRPYRSFEQLEQEMEICIRDGNMDAVVHCAAVSDYRTDGIFAPAPGTNFENGLWLGSRPGLIDKSADKIKSDEPELWLRLVRTPKLVDRVRKDWGFRGILVKFKLEVGIGQSELLDRAERSRLESNADLMVANTLETKSRWAHVGPLNGQYERVERGQLPYRLLETIEQLYRERKHG